MIFFISLERARYFYFTRFPIFLLFEIFSINSKVTNLLSILPDFSNVDVCEVLTLYRISGFQKCWEGTTRFIIVLIDRLIYFS